jgi:hypothetical protein
LQLPLWEPEISSFLPSFVMYLLYLTTLLHPLQELEWSLYKKFVHIKTYGRLLLSRQEAENLENQVFCLTEQSPDVWIINSRTTPSKHWPYQITAGIAKPAFFFFFFFGKLVHVWCLV